MSSLRPILDAQDSGPDLKLCQGGPRRAASCDREARIGETGDGGLGFMADSAHGGRVCYEGAALVAIAAQRDIANVRASGVWSDNVSQMLFWRSEACALSHRLYRLKIASPCRVACVPNSPHLCAMSHFNDAVKQYIWPRGCCDQSTKAEDASLERMKVPLQNPEDHNVDQDGTAAEGPPSPVDTCAWNRADRIAR